MERIVAPLRHFLKPMHRGSCPSGAVSVAYPYSVNYYTVGAAAGSLSKSRHWVVSFLFEGSLIMARHAPIGGPSISCATSKNLATGKKDWAPYRFWVHSSASTIDSEMT